MPWLPGIPSTENALFAKESPFSARQARKESVNSGLSAINTWSPVSILLKKRHFQAPCLA